MMKPDFFQLKRLIMVMAILLTGLLAGCKSELYSSLTERQANEIVTALNNAGIASTRTGTEAGKFAIEVERNNFATAISVLSSQGLPSKEYETLGQVFSNGKMVETPFAENARMMYALNQELSASISQIAGVASARVHTMLPESSPFSKEAVSPRASVFIYTARDVNLAGSIPTIKNLIVNSIPNMDYENVEVAIFNGEAVSSSMAGGYFSAGNMIGQIIALVVLLGLMIVGWKLLRSLARNNTEVSTARALKSRNTA